MKYVSRIHRWYKLRQFLITRSIIADYIKPKTPIQIFKLLKNYLWFRVKMHSHYLEYGKDNEAKARDAYQARYPHFEVLESGLWVYDNYPGLCVFPDGLVFNPFAEPPFGLLEIK